MAAAGIALTNDQSNHIALLIVSIVGLIGVFLPDLFGEKKQKNENLPPIENKDFPPLEMVSVPNSNNELQYQSKQEGSYSDRGNDMFSKNVIERELDISRTVRRDDESTSSFFNDK